MQTNTKFVFTLVKLLLNFFSGKKNFPLIPKGGSSANIKKLFLRLSARDDEVLSTQNIIIFPA